MTVIKAKIMDETHLELTQPISVRQGEFILISIINNEDTIWQEKGKQQFLEAYDDGDAIYDNL
ncbi:MAG: hypothetical protein ABRQ37_18950 [Candidatus Eremiobacterota bacterium]